MYTGVFEQIQLFGVEKCLRNLSYLRVNVQCRSSDFLLREWRTNEFLYVINGNSAFFCFFLCV